MPIKPLSSQDAYASLLNTTQTLIVALDCQGRVRLLNAAAKKITGYDISEAAGRDWFKLIMPEDRYPEAWRELKKSDATCGLPADFVHPILTKSGEERIISWQNTPLKEDGEITGTLSSGIDITERKRAEEERTYLARLNQEVISGAAEGIVVYDREMRYTVWNPFMEALTGVKAESLLGKSAIAMFPHLREQGVDLLLKEALTGKTISSPDTPFHSPAGRSGWVIGTYSPHRNGKGDIIGVVGIIRDITERKQAEQALQESERRLSTLIGNLPGLVYTCAADRQWTMRYLSPGCRRLTGYAPESLLNNNQIAYNDLILPEDREVVWIETQAAIKSRRPYQYAYRIRTADDQTRWVWEQGTPIFDPQDGGVSLEGYIFDITEQKLAREQAQQASRLLQAALDCSQVGIVIADSRTRMLKYANYFGLRARGLTREDFARGISVERFLSRGAACHPDGTRLPPQDLPLIQALDGRAATMEEIIRLDDSTEISVLANAAPVRDAAGTVTAGIVVFQDISEQKKAQTELAEISARFRRTFEESPVGAVMVGTDKRFLRVNRAFAQDLGRAQEELIGRPITCVTHPEDLDLGMREMQAIAEGRTDTAQIKKRYLRKDGAVVWAEVNIGMVKDAAGRPEYFLAIIQDVTARKKAEDARAELENQLRQAQKMEAIGRLAGGIAHDFNNLLTAITSYGEMLRNNFSAADPRRAQAQEIVDASNRASTLTRQLLIFSRRQIITPALFDLNSNVKNMAAMLRRLIGENIKLETELAAAPCLVMADSGQIEQVILNLAVNARDAMPEGGTLKLKTETLSPGEDFRRAHPELPPGRLVCLSAADTGIGMNQEVMRLIFEPFFTTKEPGKGTGLGLTIVFSIVKQSGGDITVESQPGKGSIFNIYMPLASEPAAPASLLSPTPPMGGRETILVAEDEDVVRRLEFDSLGGYGYAVLSANSGKDALTLARTHGQPIHLLITDVIMPGMSGRDLALGFKQLHPQAKILYVSGFTDDTIAPRGVIKPGLSLLRKPFNPEGLARKVREVLDGPADQAQA